MRAIQPAHRRLSGSLFGIFRELTNTAAASCAAWKMVGALTLPYNARC
jgi:hypothetical protein